MKSDKPTIGEVARLARVSKTTVSRYLNDRFEFMSIETRKRIQSVIEELDYRPNNLARSLKSNRSSLIGVLVADISSPFSSILVKGIGDKCKQSGFQMIIANTDNDPSKERDYIRALMDNRVEGLIVHTTGKNNEYLIDLGKQGMPIVLADRAMKELQSGPPHFDTVTSNNFAMTYDTMKHLHEQGFRRVAFFTQEIGQIWTRLTRRLAFLKACTDLFDCDGKDFVYVIDVSVRENIKTAISQFLDGGSEPSAAFAVNGVTLLSVIQSISELELRIPSDVGLCGYDDWGWASIVPPGITVISQPSYGVGVEAAARLLMRIQSERQPKPKLIELPSKLIVRGSTILKPS